MNRERMWVFCMTPIEIEATARRHEFTKKNTLIWNGKRGTERICRECRRINNAKHRGEYD